jgi:hypothetical protein
LFAVFASFAFLALHFSTSAAIAPSISSGTLRFGRDESAAHGEGSLRKSPRNRVQLFSAAGIFTAPGRCAIVSTNAQRAIDDAVGRYGQGAWRMRRTVMCATVGVMCLAAVAARAAAAPAPAPSTARAPAL